MADGGRDWGLGVWGPRSMWEFLVLSAQLFSEPKPLKNSLFNYTHTHTHLPEHTRGFRVPIYDDLAANTGQPFPPRPCLPILVSSSMLSGDSTSYPQAAGITSKLIRLNCLEMALLLKGLQ